MIGLGILLGLFALLVAFLLFPEVFGIEPTCDSFTCPSTHTKKADPKTIQGKTKETCCDPKPDTTTTTTKCNTYTCPDGMDGESGGFKLISNAATTVGNTQATCCVEKTCADFTCDDLQMVTRPDGQGNTVAACCKGYPCDGEQYATGTFEPSYKYAFEFKGLDASGDPTSDCTKITPIECAPGYELNVDGTQCVAAGTKYGDVVYLRHCSNKYLSWDDPTLDLIMSDTPGSGFIIEAPNGGTYREEHGKPIISGLKFALRYNLTESTTNYYIDHYLHNASVFGSNTSAQYILKKSGDKLYIQSAGAGDNWSKYHLKFDLFTGLSVPDERLVIVGDDTNTGPFTWYFERSDGTGTLGIEQCDTNNAEQPSSQPAVAVPVHDRYLHFEYYQHENGNPMESMYMNICESSDGQDCKNYTTLNAAECDEVSKQYANTSECRTPVYEQAYANDNREYTKTYRFFTFWAGENRENYKHCVNSGCDFDIIQPGQPTKHYHQTESSRAQCPQSIVCE